MLGLNSPARAGRSAPAIGALLLAMGAMLIGAGPSAAAPPEYRVMYHVSGAAADGQLAEGCEPADGAERCRYWLVFAADDHRTHSPGEPTMRRERVCLYSETWWLTDGEPAAVMSATGCAETESSVVIDRRELSSATIAPTAITMQLESCNPAPGWERLCERATSWSASLSAEFTAVGPLITNRQHSRGTVPFAPKCLEINGAFTEFREAEVSAMVDGVSMSSPFAFISDGRQWAKVTCR